MSNLTAKIETELSRLGLSDQCNGRSAIVLAEREGGCVLADTDDWCAPMPAEEILEVLKLIEANQSQEDIRAELASELRAL